MDGKKEERPNSRFPILNAPPLPDPFPTENPAIFKGEDEDPDG